MPNEDLRLTLRVDKLPLDDCYPTPADFVKGLPEFLSVLVSGGVGDVIVSPSQPSNDYADKFWMRIDNNRNYIGLFSLKNGEWVQIFDATPGEVRWFSSSITLPDGWVALATVKAEDIKQEGISGAVGVPSSYTIARYDRG